MTTESRWSFIAPLWLLVSLPGLFPLSKYLPAPALSAPLALVAIGVGIVVALRGIEPGGWLRNLGLRPSWPAMLGIAALAVAAWFVYPIADALKETGGGSDADDAIKLAAGRLFGPGPVYAVETYFGNPFSPGGGWVVALAPFVALGLYPIAGAAMLAGATALMRSSRSGLSEDTTDLFVVALLACPQWWNLSFIGSDLPVLGCALLIAALLAPRTETTAQALLLSVVLGMLATARIVLFYVPVLYALLLWPERKRLAVIVGLLGSATCLAFHGFFAWQNGWSYPPLHVLGKGDTLIPIAAKVALVVVCLVIGIAMLRRALSGEVFTLASAATFVFAGLFPPLLAVALAELAFVHGFEPAAWVGAKYLIVPLPLGVAALVLARSGPASVLPSP